MKHLKVGIPRVHGPQPTFGSSPSAFSQWAGRSPRLQAGEAAGLAAWVRTAVLQCCLRGKKTHPCLGARIFHDTSNFLGASWGSVLVSGKSLRKYFWGSSRRRDVGRFSVTKVVQVSAWGMAGNQVSGSQGRWCKVTGAASLLWALRGG